MLVILVRRVASVAKRLPSNSIRLILCQGPSKIWKTTRVSPRLPLEEVDLGHVVAAFGVEPLDLAGGQAGPRGVARRLLQAGGLLDVLELDLGAAQELDVGQDGHLLDAEGQDVALALGVGLVVRGDVGEPLGGDQRLEVGLDLTLVERVSRPAQELGADLLGGDADVALDPDLDDVPLGQRVAPCAAAPPSAGVGARIATASAKGAIDLVARTAGAIPGPDGSLNRPRVIDDRPQTNRDEERRDGRRAARDVKPAFPIGR